jgi:PKD repeat protein
MAPGTDILSTVPKLRGPLHDASGYKSLSGTSMATPYVAGVIALIKSEYPSYSPEEIISTLLNTTDDIDSINPSFQGELGEGRVNAYKAVNLKPQPNIKIKEIALFDTIGARKYLLVPGEKVSLKVMLKNLWLSTNNVSIKLSTTDRFITIIDSVFTIDNIETNESKGNSSSPFLFKIDKLTPDNHVIHFNLNVYIGEYQVHFPLSFPVCIQDTIRIPSDYATIQKGIDASNSGDLIIIDPGYYYENIDFKGKDITVTSRYYETNDESYIEKTVIDGSAVVDTIANDSIHGSVVFIGNGENQAARLIGLTLTKGISTNYSPLGTTGSASFGGAIFCISASPELRKLRIIDNEAISAGERNNTGVGICMYNCKQPPVLEDLFFSKNHGASAISAYYGNAIVNKVRIRDNTDGIGIYFYSTSGKISNTQIENCSGDNSGIEVSQADSIFLSNTKMNNNGYCGINLQTCQFVDIRNAEMKNNKAGGAVFVNCQSTQILNTEIWNSQRGVYLTNCTNVDIRNSVISDNYQYGGIWINRTSINLINSTIANNTIINHYGGGAIFCADASTMNIVNSILFDNRWITLIEPVDTSFNSISFLGDAGSLMVAFSDIENGEEGIHYNNDGKNNIQLSWLEGNLDTIPMFFNPNLTDYHLMENSPLRNKGIEYFEFNDDVFLNLDPSEFFGDHPDMGAYLLPESFIKSDFVADKTLGEVPLTVNFTNLSYAFMTAPPDSFLWIFGGKDTSYVFEPSYTFTEQGEYTVSLQAFNSTLNGFMERINLIKTYLRDTIYADTMGSDSTGIGTEPYPFKTIQYAINKAEEYDVIIVNPGLYKENVQISGKDLTLASRFYLTNDTTYISGTIIDGNQNGSVIDINKITSLSNIIGFTIQNGAQLGEKSAYSGGGIYSNGSNFNLKYCIIKNNTVRPMSLS